MNKNRINGFRQIIEERYKIAPTGCGGGFDEILYLNCTPNQHRGKEALCPILCFIEETREYLLGKLCKGTSLAGEEAAEFIASISAHMPGCVQNVLLRADGEFLCLGKRKGIDGHRV